MIKYDLAWVEDPHLGEIACTDKEQLEYLKNDLKEELARLNEKYAKIYVSSKCQYQFQLSHIHDEHNDEVRWWLVKWFCDRGWEPINNSARSTSFKKVREED